MSITVKAEDKNLPLQVQSTIGVGPELDLDENKQEEAVSIQKLIQNLDSPDPETRTQTVLELSKSEDPEVINLLTKFIDERKDSTACCAASALGAIGNSKAISFLTRMSQRREPLQLQYSMNALGKLLSQPDANKQDIEEAIETLIKLLNHEHKDVRYNTIIMLGDLGEKSITSEESVDSLIKCLSDKDISTRRLASEALGKIKNPKAIPHLANLFINEREDYEVNWNAACALTKINTPEALDALFVGLTNSNPIVKLFSLEAISKSYINDPRIVQAVVVGLVNDEFELLNALLDPDVSQEIKDQAKISLEALFTEWISDQNTVTSMISTLIKHEGDLKPILLDEEAPKELKDLIKLTIQRNNFAMQIFKDIKDNVVNEGIEKCLEHPRQDFRFLTLINLAKINDPKVLPSLIGFIFNDDVNKEVQDHIKGVLSNNMTNDVYKNGLELCIKSENAYVSFLGRALLKSSEEKSQTSNDGLNIDLNEWVTD